MARPVKSRTSSAYGRDIEHLSRLRVAIMMDDSIDSDIATKLQKQIDDLVSALIVLKRQSRT
jgi:hypothetical protein